MRTVIDTTIDELNQTIVWMTKKAMQIEQEKDELQVEAHRLESRLQEAQRQKNELEARWEKQYLQLNAEAQRSGVENQKMVTGLIDQNNALKGENENLLEEIKDLKSKKRIK